MKTFKYKLLHKNIQIFFSDAHLVPLHTAQSLKLYICNLWFYLLYAFIAEWSCNVLKVFHLFAVEKN